MGATPLEMIMRAARLNKAESDAGGQAGGDQFFSAVDGLGEFNFDVPGPEIGEVEWNPQFTFVEKPFEPELPYAPETWNTTSLFPGSELKDQPSSEKSVNGSESDDGSIPISLKKRPDQLIRMRNAAEARWEAMNWFEKSLAIGTRPAGAGRTDELVNVRLLEREYNSAPDEMSLDLNLPK